MLSYISMDMLKVLEQASLAIPVLNFILKRSNDKDTKNNLIKFKEKYCLHHPQKEIVDACKFGEAELKSSLNLKNCLKKLYFEKTQKKNCEPLYIQTS